MISQVDLLHKHIDEEQHLFFMKKEKENFINLQFVQKNLFFTSSLCEIKNFISLLKQLLD